MFDFFDEFVKMGEGLIVVIEIIGDFQSPDGLVDVFVLEMGIDGCSRVADLLKASLVFSPVEESSLNNLEEIALAPMPLSELAAMARDGRLQDAKSVVAIHRLVAYLNDR